MNTSAPWEMSCNGRTWRDMPGGDHDTQKLHFYLFRMGKLDYEEVAWEKAQDACALDYVRHPLKMVLVAQRHHGRPRVGKTVGLAEREEARRQAELEVAQARVAKAAAKTRLMAWREKQDGALRQIAALAAVNYDNICRFVREGRALGPERLAAVVTLLDELDAGTVVLRASQRGRGLTLESRRVQCPVGYMPFRAWVERESAKMGLKPHSLYAWMSRDASRMPEILRVHGRAWFVRPECVAVGFKPSARWQSRRANLNREVAA